ncbi:MAG: hypothetical protein WCO60_16860 [Verrucomicrobiota bacterium]
MSLIVLRWLIIVGYSLYMELFLIHYKHASVLKPERNGRFNIAVISLQGAVSFTRAGMDLLTTPKVPLLDNTWQDLKGGESIGASGTGFLRGKQFGSHSKAIAFLRDYFKGYAEIIDIGEAS